MLEIAHLSLSEQSGTEDKPENYSNRLKMSSDAGSSNNKVILIENNPANAETICAALSTPDGLFEVRWFRTFAEGLIAAGRREASVILLNLVLPDSQGLDTFDKLSAAVPDVPILIFAEANQESMAKQAVLRGAKDFVPRLHVDSYSLPRALRCAIEHKAVEKILYMERDRAAVTLNSIGDAVLCTNVAGNVTYLNPVAEAMTGWKSDEAIGQSTASVFHIIDGPAGQRSQDPTRIAVEQDRTVSLTPNCVLVRRDGFESAIEDSTAPIHDQAGSILGAVVVFHDVTAARAALLKMAYSAQHDSVTGLPNRLLLNDRIAQAIAFASRYGQRIAVVFLDLDHFKYINDSLGHSAGDRLLQSISKRLLANVRGSDTVSRQGGDEFVILLNEITYPSAPASIAEKLLVSLRAAHTIDGEELYINGSIGISLYPEDGKDAETLIGNADTAMYHAKAHGRNTVQFFDEEMNRKAAERQSLENNMRRALEWGEFVLHYQPKVRLDTGEITGVEALIRWLQPERGLIPPQQFVPIAEDSGLIVPIGRWVLHRACSQARTWQKAGLLALPIAINVSAVEFRAKGFASGVRSVLLETGLAAQYLELELTEGVLMEDAESTVAVLQELKEMGVHLAVDDFGTGYSSLSYLRRFPLQVLKIDRSFVQQITTDGDASKIVSAIVSVGKSLGFDVIAEGVETEEQKAYLRSLHCTEGQGYLFSRPLAADQFADLLIRATRSADARSRLVPSPMPAAYS